jgi:hypothetical protein
MWKRVQEHAGPAPKGMQHLATQWVINLKLEVYAHSPANENGPWPGW